MNKIKFAATIAAVVVVALLLCFSAVSCKRDKGGNEGEYVIQDEGTGEDVIVLNQNNPDETINWEAEKIKLKGIGKIDVEIYCKIAAMWRLKLDSEGVPVTKQNFTPDEIEKLKKEREDFIDYFGLKTAQFDDFGDKNSDEINQFIIGHPAYQKVLMSIQGVDTP